MSRELFGTDGVRGPAGLYPLDHDGTVQIGRAVGTHFAEVGETIMIGCDTRESSPQLVEGLAAGIESVGVNTEIAGVIPTPGLAYTTRENAVAAGVMVTASHNPWPDNGVKVFDKNGDKLPDNTETTLNAMIAEGVPDRKQGTRRLGTTAVERYTDFLVKSAGGTSFDGLRIGLDTANGAASGIAAEVFTRLGADVVPIADNPDGRNINEQCGATDTKMLRTAVIEQGLHLWAAFDGDADRLMMVDEKGREFNGDHIMYTLAAADRHPGVVATVMTNLGTENAMRERDIELLRTDVGDRYVLEGLRQSGHGLGGEQSGHIVMPNILATGDGMLAAIQTIRAVRESGLSLAEWRDQVKLLPQKLVNIPVADKSLLRHDDVQAFVQEVTDGLGNKGRVLIRPSGTEPKARIMVEAPSEDDAHKTAQWAASGLQRLLGRLVA